MKSRTLTCIIVFAALANPALLCAQEAQQQKVINRNTTLLSTWAPWEARLTQRAV